jgi:hypothetical protein
MPTTPKLGLPYPVLPDPADVPEDVGELATKIDDLAGTSNGLAQLGPDGKVPAAQLPPAPGAIDPALLDAKGDLIVATADNTPDNLPAGSPGDVLVVDPAAPHGVRWATPVDIPTTIIDAKGDLIAGTGPDTPARVPAGVDGQFLLADSSVAPGVKWGAPPATSGIPLGIVDAKGDLIGASGADTPARLPVGADGHVLTVDAAQPLGLKYAAPPSGLPPVAGHEGHWLKVSGGAAVWEAANYVPLALVTAKGQIVGASGAGVPAPIPAGTGGQVLVARPAQPLGAQWETPVAGGAKAFPFSLRNANVVGLPGNAYPMISTLTLWEAWAWGFSATASGVVYGVLRLPANVAAGGATLQFEIAALNAGDVRFQVELAGVADGGTLNFATWDYGPFQATVTLAARARKLVTSTAVTIGTHISPGELVVVKIARLGADAADTNTSPMELYAADLVLD